MTIWWTITLKDCDSLNLFERILGFSSWGFRFRPATFKLGPCVKCLVTLGAAELFITGVGSAGSFMYLWITRWEPLNSLSPVWFIHVSSVYLIGCICSHRRNSWMVCYQRGLFHVYQGTWCWGFIILEAAEWFITIVNSFMFCQIIWCWAFVITL